MSDPLTDAQRALVEQVAHYASATVSRKPLAPRMRQEWEDIVGDCYLALCRAAIAYDSTGGRKWQTYAIACVRHIPTEYLRREDHLGRYQRDREDRRAEVRQALFARLGRQPRADEIATALGITEDQAEEWRTRAKLAGAWKDCLPLHQPVSKDDAAFARAETLEDVIPSDTPTPEQEIVRQDLAAQVRQAIDALPTARLQDIATQCLLLGRQQKSVAQEWGISESRIHQLMRDIESHLRRTLATLVEETN